MPIPVSIESLLEKHVVESARIEFKEGWNPESILHTICAFANDINNIGGGYIVVGVAEENGRPVLPPKGIDVNELDDLQKKLLQLCQFTRPKYSPVYEPVEYMGKHLLLIWCPAGYDRMYAAAANPHSKKSQWVNYVRRSSSTVVPNDSERKAMEEISCFVPFDDRVNYQASLSDLRLSYMEEFLTETESALLPLVSDMSKQDLAQNLRVLGGPPESIHPRNVGLMMFSSRPDDFFRYTRIEVVNIPDPTGIGMTEKIFTGPIDRQIRSSLAYIHDTVIEEKIFKHPDRAEAERVFNYPFAAIEEALTNAVYHRGYQIPEPITVRIEKDRISILSLPGPDHSISDEDLANYRLVSAYNRNRRIGDFLKELHLIEGRNTGMPTILRTLKENGSKPPLLETDEDKSYFRITFFINERFTQSGYEDRQPYGRNIPKPRNVRAMLREMVKATAMAIVEEEGAVTTGYLAEQSEVSKQTAARALKELEGNGVLSFVGKSKTDPHQHYVLAR